MSGGRSVLVSLCLGLGGLCGLLGAGVLASGSAEAREREALGDPRSNGLASFVRSSSSLAWRLGFEPDRSLPTEERTGPPRWHLPRPPSSRSVRLCSFEEPLCVHAPTGLEAQGLERLREAEGALRGLRVLGLERRLGDGALGGGPELDLYLSSDDEPSGAYPDPLLEGLPLDGASAFLLEAASPSARQGGCVRPFTLAEHLAEALLLGLEASASAGEVVPTASYLASLASPCALAELEAIDEVQRRPERALTSATRGHPSGHLLWGQSLEERSGSGGLPGVLPSLFALAAQRTPPSSSRLSNEPDLFDALRASARAAQKSAGELLLDYAVDRAFVGSRSGGLHLREAAHEGDLGHVRFEWTVPWQSLPRRLAPLRPLEPTGASYLWVDLQGAGSQDTLHLAIDWELPVLFRWALVKVDREGRERGRVDLAPVFGSTHADKTVEQVEGLGGLLLVGVNEGDLRRDWPFDPDEAPFEPHAYTLTLYR